MNKDLKIVAMIPARLDSTRFPKKLMRDLNGKTVIRRTYEATVSTELFEEVYVVTDSKEIFIEIDKNGGNAIYKTTAHETGSDRIAEAAEEIEADIIVNVQGDEPFTSKELLEKLLHVFKKDEGENIDLATPMIALTSPEEIENPNNVKVITDHQNLALYFSRSAIPYLRDKTQQTTYYKHIGIYAFRRQALLDFAKLEMQKLEAAEKIECLRYLEYGKKIKMVETSVQTIGIDTPEDLEKAREMFKS